MSVDFQKTVEELYSLIDYERVVNPGPYQTNESHLEKYRAVLANRGNPQFRYRTIHIAGSKGKGSTSAVCESILRAGGLKTGLYTSPHLVDIRERIRIDGKLISREIFARKVSELIEYAREIGVPKGYRTVFEILTAAAFEIFAENGVEIAVIEAGLGGKLDATNVLQPSATVITPIGLDHTEILGNTVQEIAADKAQIFRNGVPVILGPQLFAAREVLADYASEAGAPIKYELSKSVLISSLKQDSEGTEFDLEIDDKIYRQLRIPLLGKYQTVNTAIAVATICSLRECGVEVEETAIREGLSKVRWPGRMHLFRGEPEILIDGAHSPMAVESLLESIRGIWPGKRLITIFAANRDKDLEGMISQIAPETHKLILTRFDWPRAARPEEIAKFLGEGTEATRCETLASALEIAKEEALPTDLILITGSLYLVGEALKQMNFDPDTAV
jgi:dihydrofolate synthase/folylpolyglutamate synthase